MAPEAQQPEDPAQASGAALAALPAFDPDELLRRAGVDPDEDARATAPSDAPASRQLRLIVLSEEPRIVVAPGAVSAAECEHLLGIAAGCWAPSSTSTASVPLRRAQTVVVERVERRLAAAAGTTEDALGPLELARWSPGCTSMGEAEPRPLAAFASDASRAAGNENGSKRRKAAALMVFLGVAPHAGGALAFPRQRFQVLPRRGAALVWFPDPASEHLGCQWTSAPSGRELLILRCRTCDGTSSPGPPPVLVEGVASASDVPIADVQGFAAKEGAEGSPELTAYLLRKEPKLSVMPRLLDGETAAQLVASAEAAARPSLNAGGTDATVLAERRISAFLGAPLAHLSELRPLHAPREDTGERGRGCGARAAYVCLCKEEDVFFPALAVRIRLRCGDAVSWANTTPPSGAGAPNGDDVAQPVEDLRTCREHLMPEGAKADGISGMEAFVLAAPVRELWEQHRPPPPPALPALQGGAVVSFGGAAFHLLSPIGTGSFGVAWAAERAGDAGSAGTTRPPSEEGGDTEPSSEQGTTGGSAKGDIVVKETWCRSEFALGNAQQEAMLLQALRSSSTHPNEDNDDADPLCRIPAFVATEAFAVAEQGLWCVRLAMSRLPGVPLDTFIARTRRGMLEDKEAAAAPADRFFSGCRFARRLILQLAPTLERIATIAYHRDLNCHNVLVSGDMENPSFTLVDFGLAASLAGWHGPPGPRSWHHMEIGGDSRYWPMSGWFLFLAGLQELFKYPQLCEEYATRLDFHALGICALQALADFAAPPEAAPEAEAEAKAEAKVEAAKDGPLADEATALLQQWSTFWAAAHRAWEILYAGFRVGGEGLEQARVACIQEGDGAGVHNVMGRHLQGLRAAISAAHGACQRGAGDKASDGSGKAAALGLNLQEARPLFNALLDLVSAAGDVGGPREEGAPIAAPAWHVVRLLADGGERPPVVTQVPAGTTD